MTRTVVVARTQTPHRLAALLAILIAVALTVLGVATPAFASYSSTLASLVNHDRAAHGLAPLARSSALDAVASRWAHQMAANDKMSHNPSLASQVPSGWRALGENVAMGQPSPQAMEAAWMNSPGHRANILGSYTHVGVAFIVANGYTWGVEVFAKYPTTAKAKPKAAAPPKSAPAKTASKSAATTPRKPAPAKIAPVKPAPAPKRAPAKPSPGPTPAATATPRPTMTPSPTASLLAPSSSTTPVAVAIAGPAAPASSTAPLAPSLGIAVLVLGVGATAFAMVRRRRAP